MAKKVIEEKKEVIKKEETKKVEQVASMSVEDLVKQLKDKEKLKTVIENQYHQLCGQIQLLYQMISALEEKR